MDKLYVASGIVLIAFAILIAFLPVILDSPIDNAEYVVTDITTTSSISIVAVVDEVSGNTMYLPAHGTEVFAWEDKEWKYINTGQWSYTNMDDVYGSLYRSNIAQWMIVTERGQIIEFVSNGGEAPQLISR